jgi:hypothetical protein
MNAVQKCTASVKRLVRWGRAIAKRQQCDHKFFFARGGLAQCQRAKNHFGRHCNVHRWENGRIS